MAPTIGRAARVQESVIASWPVLWFILVFNSCCFRIIDKGAAPFALSFFSTQAKSVTVSTGRLVKTLGTPAEWPSF